MPRGPSKKKQRQYQSEMDAFTRAGSLGSPPEPPTKNMDICPACTGSGLQRAPSAVQVDAKNYPSVAIIGGGIGGVAFAVACAHRGIPFTLYERDVSFDARSQGYGLTLQQASKAIEGLGVIHLDDRVISTRHVVHNPDGKIIGEWGLRKWGIPFEETHTKRRNVHIARQTLRSALLTELGEHASLQWGHTFQTFSQNKNGGIDLTFQVDGQKKIATADLVVGADGIRSTVRATLIGEHKSPLQYLGCIVMLGICPLKSLRDKTSPLLDSATVFQTVNGTERMYAMPYDKNTIMWQLSFPMEEEDAKKLSARGASAMKEEAHRRLQNWHDPIPEILTATLPSDITGYPVYDRALLDPSVLSEKGNATLLGDAAHPMSPFKGQGANQALLDALSLARSIATTCGPDSKWRDIGLRETVLQAFEKEMVARTNTKVKDSAEAVRLLHSDAVLHTGDEPRGRGLYPSQ